MVTQLVGINGNGALNIYNFSHLKSLYIVYPKEEGDRIGSLTLEIMKKQRFTINDFYDLIEKELGATLTRFPLQGEVIIEFTSLHKQIIPEYNKYSIKFDVKLYFANDIVQLKEDIE